MEWLQPYTDAKIKELGASGVKQLLAVPISFVSEHIETLEEIDMEYRELAIKSGIKVKSCGLHVRANVLAGFACEASAAKVRVRSPPLRKLG